MLMVIRILTAALILSLSAIGLIENSQHSDTLSDNLKRYSPGGCGLSLQLPGQAIPINVPTPKDLSRQIKYLKYYMYKGDHLVVFIGHCSSFETFAAKPFAEGVVKGIIGRPDITDLQYSTEPSTTDKAPLKGTYKQSGITLEMNGITIVQATHTWFILGLYRQSDKLGRQIAQRALDSVKFDGPACPEQVEEVIGFKHSGIQDLRLTNASTAPHQQDS